MKERGIIFNAEMVRSILSGQKTQTRRIVKGVPSPHDFQGWVMSSSDRKDEGKACWGVGEDPLISQMILVRPPFGEVGDRLWVRETWRRFNRADECGCESPCSCPSNGAPLYRASYDDGESKWRPSIHMPRGASRILLEITGVRVEKLNDISEADAQAEGITFTDYGLSRFRTQKPGWFWRKSSSSDECLSSAYWAFCNLWTNVYGEESWRSNPWVWVIEFKRVEGGAA